MSEPETRGIEGRVVAVTGAGRGIGAAIAELLAARGCRVTVGDIDEVAAAEAASRLGAGHHGMALDVTDGRSFAEFLDRAEDALGPLDVLVNNAGVMWVGPFDDEPEEAARRQFDVNFHGAARGMRLALARMRERGRGSRRQHRVGREQGRSARRGDLLRDEARDPRLQRSGSRGD